MQMLLLGGVQINRVPLSSMRRVDTNIVFVKDDSHVLSELFIFQQKLAYWFATGGAGFCISKGLALKMMPHAR